MEGLEKERDFYFEKVRLSVFFALGWTTDTRHGSFAILRFWYNSSWKPKKKKARTLR